MNMPKVVYITGCLGFIGSYVTRRCLQLGWYVRGVDKCTYAANPELLSEFNSYETFTFEKADINEIEFLYECDYLINCAAETHVGNSIVHSHDFVRSNIDGVHHILELLRLYRSEGGTTPILIHFSTDEVYGDISIGAHTEQDLLKPSNPYSATKAAADMLIIAWARTYEMPYVIVRPTNNYGIGQYIEKLIPKACKYLKLGKKLPLHNQGTPIRNWLHADDTARAVLAIIDNSAKNEIFNVCGGFEQTNLSTAEKIIRCYHGDVSVREHLDLKVSRPGQDMRYALDDSKLRNIGWRPERIFDNEIAEIVNYYRNHFIW